MDQPLDRHHDAQISTSFPLLGLYRQPDHFWDRSITPNLVWKMARGLPPVSRVVWILFSLQVRKRFGPFWVPASTGSGCKEAVCKRPPALSASGCSIVTLAFRLAHGQQEIDVSEPPERVAHFTPNTVGDVIPFFGPPPPALFSNSGLQIESRSDSVRCCFIFITM